MKKSIFLLITLIIFIYPKELFALEISSPNAILIELESGKTLYEKNADELTYPASTTKILTTILALEKCNPYDSITASYNAVMSVPYDGTTAAIQVGETWTVEQLVDAMMVCSANEAANIIAEHIGGTQESFASIMNARAKELGASNTNFVNANGLHDDAHQTTVRDMAIIARHGLLNVPGFKEAAQLKEFSLPDTPIYTKSDRTFSNTNKLIIPSSSYYYEYATGIKTGYTSKALNCIVASANKNGVELIAVVFGSTGAENRTNDVKALFEYGFSRLKSARFLLQGEKVEEIKISGATAGTSNLIAVSANNIVHTIPLEKDYSDYAQTIKINENLKAPIASGEVVGTVSYEIEGQSYEYDLVASGSANSIFNSIASIAIKTTKAIGKVIFWAVMSVVGIFIALIFIRASIINKKRNTRRMRSRAYNARFRR